MSPSACPTRTELAAFDAGDLRPADLDRVADHVATCPNCEAVLQQLDDRTLDPGLLFAGMGGQAAGAPEPPGELDAQRTAAGHTRRAPPGFRIERELASGGMGEVYLAVQEGLNRQVALKMVRAGGRGDAASLVRFLAEAEAVASVRHPNVVEVYSYGDHHGQPYLAMEYCPAGDMTALTATGRPRDVAWFRRAAEVMAAVADGVQAAHAQGIVHRDLKPGNVLLAADGTPKVADFGLAKRGLGSNLTRTNMVLGTPAYMAPEQAGGGTKFVGPEADVWALGVMLYELCGGGLPVDTSGPVLEALANVARGQVTPLRVRAPTVPTDLRRVAHKCLRCDPRDRYPTAAGVAADLRNWLAGKPISARPVGTVEALVKWARRNKLAAARVLALLLTMATATGVSLGFGLEARFQAARANNAKKQVEQSMETVLREKQEADDAKALAERKGQEVIAAQGELYRILGQALLGRFSDTGDGEPSELEVDTLWQLALLRDRPVAEPLFVEACRTPSMARKLGSRPELIYHAVVGLDAKRRNQVDDLLSTPFREPDLPAPVRQELAVAAALTNQASVATQVADALVEAAEDERVSDRAVVRGLVAVVPRLTPEVAERVSELGAYYLVGRLAGPFAHPPDDELAGLVVMMRRMTPEAVLELCRIAVGQARFTGGSAEKKPEFVRWARLLAVVSERLPRPEGEGACDAAAKQLLDSFNKSSTSAGREHSAGSLAAIAPGLSEAKAGEMFDAVAEAWGKRSAPDEPHLARAMVAFARRRPPDVALPKLQAALKDKKVRGVGPLLARELADTAVRLRSEKGEEVLLAAMEEVKGAEGEWGVLAEGVVRMAAGQPVEQAVKSLETLLGRAVQQNTWDRTLVRTVAASLAAATDRLSGTAGGEVRERVAGTLRTSLTALGRQASITRWADRAAALAVVCERLPAPESVRFRQEAVVAWLNLMGRERPPVDTVIVLAALTDGLTTPEANRVRAEAADLMSRAMVTSPTYPRWPEAAAYRAAWGRDARARSAQIAFSTVIGAAVRPVKPTGMGELSPQGLVDLLKHPFCVKGTRRAVLNALEFTYDRKFADLWVFVAFAEAEHPEIDLLSPPKRPEEK